VTVFDPFVVAALVGIPLAQVPLAMYLSRFVELDEDEPRPSPERGYVTYGTVSSRPSGRRHDPICPHCSASIDGDYDYCGVCAGRLPPRRAR
jgi:hypothetical protein